MTRPDFRNCAVAALLMSASALGGCASSQPRPPVIRYDEAVPAVLAPEPPKPVEVVKIPQPLPLPGQLKLVPAGGGHVAEAADPKDRVGAANAAARVQRARSAWHSRSVRYRSS